MPENRQLEAVPRKGVHLLIQLSFGHVPCHDHALPSGISPDNNRALHQMIFLAGTSSNHCSFHHVHSWHQLLLPLPVLFQQCPSLFHNHFRQQLKHTSCGSCSLTFPLPSPRRMSIQPRCTSANPQRIPVPRHTHVFTAVLLQHGQSPSACAGYDRTWTGFWIILRSRCNS